MHSEKHRVRQLYEAYADQYDQMTGVVEWLGVRRLRRELFGEAVGRVLEVAVGTGANLPLYGTRVAEVIGIDLSEAMLERARRRAAGLAFPVALNVGDAENLAFLDASFDTVVSSLATCTFPDPARALREMARVCRPGGRILLLEHGRSRVAWIGRLQDRGADWHHQALGCRWNREPLRMVEEAGLRIARARRLLLGVFHVIVATPPLPRPDPFAPIAGGSDSNSL